VEAPKSDGETLGNLDALAAALEDGDALQPVSSPALAPGSDPRSGLHSGHPSAPAESAGPVRTCPSCKQRYPSNVTLCVECGIDLRTGRPLLTTQDENLDSAYMYADGIVRVLSFIMWVGITPIASEAFGLRKPFVIRGITLVTVLISLWYMIAFIYSPTDDAELRNLMLWSGDSQRADEYPGEVGEFRGYQLITNILLHGDLGHLIGNMIFLWIFGTAVNALIGNTLTIALYPLLGICADVAHIFATADDAPMPSLGASGAIMGLAGMYLVLFPVHRVHMVAWLRLTWFFPVWMKIWSLRGFWVVLSYIVLDVIFTIITREDDNVAHWAHFGGFAAGVVAAMVLLIARLVNARGGDLLTFLLGRHAWALIGRPNRPGITLP
jgi:membrane associated rhomboid family serine protease